jgi:hypothetical protein
MSSIRVRCGISRPLLLLAFLSFQSLADVISLVVDPQSTNTVYAGMSQGGVFKRTDGGATASQDCNTVGTQHLAPLCAPVRHGHEGISCSFDGT